MPTPLRLQNSASLAVERDEEHSSRLRHVQRAHQAALEHARSAADANTANELAKQKDEIVRRLGDSQAIRRVAACSM